MIDFLKNFGAYLVLSNIGRLMLSGIIMFFGAVLANNFEYYPLFFVGLIGFALQCAYMAVCAIINFFDDLI